MSSLSEAYTPKLKQAKMTLSPASARKLLATPGGAAGMDLMHSQRKLTVGDSFDVAAFAAAVFYAVFAHLDHWPAELVKAYADDCFGPRLWVDNDECKLLVENLALVHSSEVANNSNGVDEAATKSEEAQSYADYYGYLVKMVPKEEKVDENDDDNKSRTCT